MSLTLSCIDLDWELHRWCPFVKPFPARYAFNISALVGGHKSWQVWLHLKLDQHHDSDLGYVNSDVLCKIPFIRFLLHWLHNNGTNRVNSGMLC